MFEHLRATWLAGVRSRSLRVVTIAALCLIFLSYLASSFSGRHPQTVALDVSLSGAKLIMALLALFWVQELFSRELMQKTVLFALSYPVARWKYVVGRLIGILSLLLLSISILAIAIYGMVILAGSGYHQAFQLTFGYKFVWVVLGVWLDAAVIAAFSICVASVATSSLMPLFSGLGFALIARSLGVVLLLLKDPDGGFADQAKTLLPWLERLAFVVPDLSALDWRGALLYGLPIGKESWIAALHGSSSLVLLTLLAVALFGRREFN